MASPLLYDLVNKLEKSEIRQLKKYVRSPFVTHRTDLGQMFNALATCLAKGKKLPEKEELFEQTFGAETYDDHKLRRTMSDLYSLLEQYLIWNHRQQDAVENQLTLATIYRQRNLPKHFRRKMDRVQHLQERASLKNSDFYQYLLDYQIEEAQFQSANRRTGQLNLQEIGDTIDQLYVTQKLRHVCTQLSHRAVYQAAYQFGLLEQWIDRLEESDYLQIPAIAVYYYCYRFLTDAYSQVYFRKFREELSQSHHHFPPDELKNLYRAAINFCIRKLNEGDLEFTREGWQLFQEGLNTGIFLENDRLSRFTFDNIVGFGLKLNAFKEVEQFIAKFEDKLDPVFRESTVFFNRARLEYGRRNYQLALEHLIASDPKDLVNKLIAKTLQLKIYFDSDELNLLESHLDNFRLFIRRREVSDYHRQNFQNIIYYTRKLIALAPYDRVEQAKLLASVQEESVLTERSWFLEKLMN